MDDINVSDDLDFVRSNRDYVGFVSMFHGQSLTRHVTRVADVNEDAVEVLYEKRVRKRSLVGNKDNTVQHEVDPVDALPVKTLDGRLYYKSVKAPSKFTNNEDMMKLWVNMKI